MSKDSEDATPLPDWAASDTGTTQLYNIQVNGGSVGGFGEPGWSIPASPATQSSFSTDAPTMSNRLMREKVNDIPVEIEAIIGRTKVSVAELMRVGQGHEFRLDRRFGEPIELRVNGRVIGYGEIVADDGDHVIGIRMTRLAG
ncbi:FliM/FliN family flagellar motor switch protein [Rhizobium binxianense]